MYPYYIQKNFYPALGSTSRYHWDWRRYLAALFTTIDTFEVIVPDGVILGATDAGSGESAGIVTAFLTVPALTQASYTVKCNIVTADGDITTRSIILSPRDL